MKINGYVLINFLVYCISTGSTVNSGILEPMLGAISNLSSVNVLEFNNFLAATLSYKVV